MLTAAIEAVMNVLTALFHTMFITIATTVLTVGDAIPLSI